MTRIVIIEGMRGSGKTTVAEEAAKRYNREYVKFERGISPSIDMPLSILKLWITRRRVIIDRFHLTEYVMRCYDHKLPIWYVTLSTQFITWLLRAAGAHTLILTADEDEVYRRLIQRQDVSRMYDMSYPLAAASWVSAGLIWNTYTMPCNSEIQKESILSWIGMIIGG